MEINSLSGELTQSTDNTKAIPCKHFSIRGFVAGMRQKNWKMTSPFILDESEEQPLLSLPPLVARRFRNSRCGNCVEQVKAEANCKKEERNLSSEEPQEAPMSNSNFQRIEIDLNKPIELDSDDDDDDHSKDTMPTNNEKQYDAKVGVDRITVYETSLENNLNQDVPNVPSSEKCSSPMQGVVHTNKRGSEGNVVSDMELDNRLENNLNHEVPINSSLEEGQDPIQEVMRTIERGSEVNVVSNMEHDTTINLNNMDKSSSEVGKEVRSTTKNNQCPTELRTSKEIIMREAEVVAEDNVIEHTIEEFPPKSMDNEVNVPPRNMDNNVENDGVLDLHKKNSIKSRRKQRKMRLLDEIFRENDEANIKKVTVETQSHSNVPLQTRSSIPDKVVTIEVEKKVTKRGKGRKGKSQPISKKCVEADVSLKRAEIEVQNIKGNAAKGKGKVLVESNKEIDNDKMVEDSLVQKEAEHLPNMPVSTANPPAPNGEELEEGLHLSSINPSLGLICNNRSFPRQEFQLPWPFQEGTSTWRPIRGGGGINPFRQQHYYSKNSMDAISRKGKDVLIEEIDEDKSKNVSAECSEPSSAKNFIDLTQEDDDNESDQHSLGDIITEVADITNQYSVDEVAMEVAEIMITSLPGNRALENTPQKENPEKITDEEINGITTRGENNVIPKCGTPINYHSFGNPFGLSNLYSTHSPYRFALLPSNEVYISPTNDANNNNNNIGVSQTSCFNWGISSSSNHTLHVEENDHNPTFQIDTTKPMSLNNAFLRYDARLKKIVSHPSSTGMTFPPFDSMPNQEKKIEIDLNEPCSDEITEPETLNENIGVGTMSKKSLEASPNQRQCFDLNSTEPTPNMNGSIILHPASLCVGSNNVEMQRRTLKGFDGVNVNSDGNMSMFGNGKMNGSASAPFTQNGKLFGWFDCETETPLSVTLNTVVNECSCEINKNPADFSVPEPGNPYMNNDRGEEEKEEGVEDENNASNKMHASTSKRGGYKKRNSKKH